MSFLREGPIAILPGQYFDAETGLHQNWHRDYDPSIGRYLQSDPIGLYGGGLNTYAYVRGNPLSLIDPMGLMDLKIPGATGETAVHANPGPDVVPPGAPREHLPPHVHLGDRNGPRMRTDTWEPYSDEDERRMSRKQKKFCKKLSDADKTLIAQRQMNVFKYGKVLSILLATPPIALDSMTSACKQDPFFCMETFPEVLDSFAESCGEECQ